MALGDVRIMDYLRVAWRELMVSLGLGVTMAFAAFLLAWWQSGLLIARVTGMARTCIIIFGRASCRTSGP